MTTAKNRVATTADSMEAFMVRNPAAVQAELRTERGPHRAGRSCPNLKCTADVDLAAPEHLIAKGVGAQEKQRVQ